MSAQFVYLYNLPVGNIEPKTLASAIKVSKGTVAKTCEGELNCGAYKATRMFYIEHLSGWDMILGIPTIQNM